MARAEAGDLIQRMLRAARLDSSVYEEVEADKDATGQAAFIVVATSIAASIGGAGAGANPLGVGIGAFVSWAIYAWIAYFIGTKALRGRVTQADWGEVARPLGFASTPRFLLLAAVLPALAPLVLLTVGVWMFAATVIALRSALDFSTWRAVLTAVLSGIIQVVVLDLVT